MHALSQDEKAALYPLVRRIGPAVVTCSVSAVFVVVALAALLLTGSLLLGALVAAVQFGAAIVLFAAVYAWCLLEDATEQAHREVTAPSGSRATSRHAASRQALPRDPRFPRVA